MSNTNKGHTMNIHIAAIITALSATLPSDASVYTALRIRSLAEYAATAPEQVSDELLSDLQGLVPVRDHGARLQWDAPLADRIAQLDSELGRWAARCKAGSYAPRPGFASV